MWEHPTMMVATGTQYPGRVFERGSAVHDQPGVYILFRHNKGKHPYPDDLRLEHIGVTLNLRSDVANPAVGQWTHCWLYHQEDEKLRTEAFKALSASSDPLYLLR